MQTPDGVFEDFCNNEITLSPSIVKLRFALLLKTALQFYLKISVVVYAPLAKRLIECWPDACSFKIELTTMNRYH